MPLATRGGRRRPAAPRGSVYLIHFTTPFHHARHYVGFTDDLARRLAEHRIGAGSRLLAAVAAAGIAFEVVWTWRDATRAFERKVHRYKNTPALCPRCAATDVRARRYRPRIAPER